MSDSAKSSGSADSSSPHRDKKGSRYAVVASALIFGLVHLPNLYDGSPLFFTSIQFAVAFALGILHTEVVELTGSLWLCVAFHMLFDVLTSLNAGCNETLNIVTAGAFPGPEWL